MTIKTDTTITIKIIIVIINKRFICLIMIGSINRPIVIFWLYVFVQFYLFMIVVINVLIMTLIIVFFFLVFIASICSILLTGCLLKTIDVILIIEIIETIYVVVEHRTHTT